MKKPLKWARQLSNLVKMVLKHTTMWKELGLKLRVVPHLKNLKKKSSLLIWNSSTECQLEKSKKILKEVSISRSATINLEIWLVMSLGPWKREPIWNWHTEHQIKHHSRDSTWTSSNKWKITTLLLWKNPEMTEVSVDLKEEIFLQWMPLKSSSHKPPSRRQFRLVPKHGTLRWRSSTEWSNSSHKSITLHIILNRPPSFYYNIYVTHGY